MIRVFSLTECGGHATNEDAFAIQPHPRAADCWIAVIADGQGGRAGGAKAAQLACKIGCESASSSAPASLQSITTWCEILHEADRAVADDPIAGYTTLVGLSVWNAHVCGASNGDGAAILLNETELSWELTARQDKSPPIGSGRASIVPFAAPLAREWTLLAMTDGVWKYVGWDVILTTWREVPGENIAARLLERARMNDGTLQDDFTLIVLQSDVA